MHLEYEELSTGDTPPRWVQEGPKRGKEEGDDEKGDWVRSRSGSRHFYESNAPYVRVVLVWPRWSV